MIVVNDVSEAPTLEALAAAGYPILSIWHVDVVDYFNKLYLRRIVAPEKLTKLHERMRSVGADWMLPDVLNLVFEKAATDRLSLKADDRALERDGRYAHALLRGPHRLRGAFAPDRGRALGRVVGPRRRRR